MHTVHINRQTRLNNDPVLCTPKDRAYDTLPGQLSLAIPSWIGEMSTSQRAVTPCGWGVKAGEVCVWMAAVIPLLHTGHIRAL